MESRFTLQLKATKNTHFIKKKLQIKIVQNSIIYKKTSGHICLSLPGVVVEAPKIAIFETLEWESKFTREKYQLCKKKASNKN